MKSAKEIVTDNLPWIITTLLAIGAFGATIKYHGDVIAANGKLNDENRDRISAMEKTVIRLEIIQEDIKIIKEDIKDMKKILFKPVIGSNISENENNENLIVSSSPKSL